VGGDAKRSRDRLGHGFLLRVVIEVKRIRWDAGRGGGGSEGGEAKEGIL
jgi:hypothetical protein